MPWEAAKASKTIGSKIGARKLAPKILEPVFFGASFPTYGLFFEVQNCSPIENPTFGPLNDPLGEKCIVSI